MTSSRDVVLGRVRAALAGTRESVPVLRDYRTSTDDDLEAFLNRLCDYDATVLHSAVDGVAAAVQRRLAQREVRRLVVPAGIPPDWVTGVEALAITHR